MLTQALAGWRHVLISFRRQGKVGGDKALEVEVALVFLHLPVAEDRCGIVFWHRIGEGFLVGVELGGLHRVEQRPKAHIRRLWGAV